MISLFRFASSVQSCCGEGGALQAAVAVRGELSPCSARAARGLAPSPRARRAPSLRGPSAHRRLGLRKSLDRNRGLFAGWEGVASLGLSLPLAPPPASAGGVFRPVNASLDLPQFKKSPSDCSQGPLASPHPKECRRLLSVPPPLAGGGCERLGVLFCWELLLARNLWALFNFSSQLGGKTSPRPASARVSW